MFLLSACKRFHIPWQHENCKARGRNGFSLSEVLVVMATMVILMSLIIGSLSRARELSRIADCLSNLHQLGLAANEYAVRNHGAMPSDSFTVNGTWINELRSYYNNDPATLICPDAATPSGGVGTATLAWGPINMSGPPYSPGYPWLANAMASYGLNNNVSAASNCGALAAMGTAAIGGTDSFTGNVISASNITGIGSSTVQGNVLAGGTVTTDGNTGITGTVSQNVQGLSPPDVATMFAQIEATSQPWPASSGNLDFSTHPVQIINGNFSPSGQMTVTGSGTLLVTGNVDVTGQFPSIHVGGSVNMNIVCLGSVQFHGQTSINGSIYAAGSVSFNDGYYLHGMVVTNGTFTDRGNGTIIQGPTPSFDPRANQGKMQPGQPLFADAIWVDATPQWTDTVPQNLNLGNFTLANTDDMGIFCVNRHLNQVNVVNTDGSAHTVPLAQLWQLNWSANFIPQTVIVQQSW